MNSISKLNERLAVIDTAQKNLTDLSTNMVSLQQIFSNKQARGAFGQMRMETIIQDGLPKGAYTFQATLSNGKRPDCVLHLPNTSAGVVIDAKFPLEGFEAFRTARRDEEKKEAAKRVRVDVIRHIEAMAERYFVPGETQDTAILFVPSESIYADLAEHFDDVVQKAHRARIMICAPNMLMLAVQTMQAILKDVQMREQAHLIQREVVHLMEDIGRLQERTLDLQRHFGQANGDIEKILISAKQIGSRGNKIENLDFEAEASAQIETSTAVEPRSVGPSPSRGSPACSRANSLYSRFRLGLGGRPPRTFRCNLLLGRRAFFRGLFVALAPFHAFEFHAVGIEKEYRVVVIVIFAGGIDDLNAALLQEGLQRTHVLPVPELKRIVMEADVAFAIFVFLALGVGRSDPKPRLAVGPTDHFRIFV